MFKSSKFKVQGSKFRVSYPAFLVILAVLAPLALLANQSEIAKWDPRMAVNNAVTDTNGVKWIDGKYLPIEGRAFDDTEHYYDRLPANVTTNVNAGVRGMKHHTAGMQFRFITDSRKLTFKWVPWHTSLCSDNVLQIAMSGIDVYRQGKDGKWQYVRTGRISSATGATLSLGWVPGEPCLVNLPLYNGVKEFSLGIDESASVRAMPPRGSGVNKPVVFYGTSRSRPTMLTNARPGRDALAPWVIDVP